jgi:hypothetical protein
MIVSARRLAFWPTLRTAVQAKLRTQAPSTATGPSSTPFFSKATDERVDAVSGDEGG